MLESVDSCLEGETENSFNLFNYVLELLKPTQKDLERVMTQEEQIELCLKQKCRVDIWRWNPVNEYRLAFVEKGRYQKWNDKKQLQMLAKSVNMMKPHDFVSDDQKAEMRKNEWEIRKKDSILSLEVWNHERSKKTEQRNEVVTQLNLFGDIVGDTVAQTNQPDEDLIDDLLDFSDDETTASATNAEVTQLNQPEKDEIADLLDFSDDETTFSATKAEVTQLNQPKEEDYPHELECEIDDLSDFSYDETTDSDVSISSRQSQEDVKSVDAVALVNHLLNVNTESMTFDTQGLTQTQMAHFTEDSHHQLSPGATPSYESFDNEVAINSTKARGFTRRRPYSK